MQPLTLAAAIAAAASSAHALSLDPTDTSALTSVTKQALTNLLTYYVPNSGGVFNQVQTPWHESGMIWGTFMDYTKWTGDTSFMQLVSEALSNASYGTQQDFLGGNLVTVVETLEGRWNDDILWPSQAVIAGAELYGADTTMPGAEGPWFTSAQKTFDEAYQQWDDGCSGGIYWSRNRGASSANYKSLITQLEFISQGARNYIQKQNETSLDLCVAALNWVLGPSQLGNAQTGVLYDGTNVGSCDQITTNQWSYNYGEFIGSLAWMHKATGNDTYLDMATPFLQQALSLFAGSGTNGIVTEQCEQPQFTCNRDQTGFKAILLRNMAYLYRETSDNDIKNSIKSTISTTLNAMVSTSCDDNWNCNGNWSTGAAPIKYIRSQHVSSALLVAALGVYSDTTGSGLITNIHASALTDTQASPGSGSVNGDGGNGSVDSVPLSSAQLETKVQRFTLLFGLGLVIMVAMSI